MLIKSRFSSDDDGAVTVDWVVITAAIVLFGIAATLLVSPALTDGADSISTEIADAVAAALT